MHKAKPTPLLLLPLLMLLSGCPWALDHPDDPYRCVPGCGEGRVCREGECVKASNNDGGSQKDRGPTYYDGGAGQCNKGTTKCEDAGRTLLYCEDSTYYKRDCHAFCTNKNQFIVGCQWVAAANKHQCLCRTKDAGPDSDQEV